jgi:hypothetical protein
MPGPDQKQTSHQTQPIHPASRFFGFLTIAVGEVVFLHPVNTMARRLMTNKNNELSFNKIVFNDVAGFKQRYVSLVPGLKWALSYKICERTHSFAWQPILANWLQSKVNTTDKQTKVFVNGLAGTLLGATQSLYIPLDALRTQAQVGVLSKNTDLFAQIRQQGVVKLYNGASYYTVRTAGSASILFSTVAFIKHHMYGLDDLETANFMQNLTASTAGAFFGVVATNPLDIIKSRMQVQAGRASGVEIVKSLLKNEGPKALTKGLIPNCCSAVPKIALTLTAAPPLTRVIDRCLFGEKGGVAAVSEAGSNHMKALKK